MITWTETARTELERHVAAVRTRMIAAGADADEVAADLERHVEAELAEGKIGVATQEDVRRVLMRMGAVEAGLLGAVSEDERDEKSAWGKQPKPWFNGFVTWCCILFGVVLPLVTLGFEFFTRACSSEMFDPMPTVVHAAMIMLVPVANGLALRHATERYRGRKAGLAPRWLGLLNGAAIVVAGFYALMFAMITPIAVLGIIVYGIGLLPLAPLLSLITALICRGRLRRQGLDASAVVPGWKIGAGLGLIVMVGLEASSILTEAGIRMARSERSETVQRGLALLRSVGDEERLLKRCYPRNGVAVDLVGFLFSLGENQAGDVNFSGGRTSTEQMRTLFYRVTGKPFNLLPMPARFRFGGRSQLSEEWVWDANAGGEVVGQRLKNLTLAESRIDGTLDAKALTSYVEWTLVFKNTARWQQEARAHIVLPPGGVVSRLTLWVNGEEREAAFAGRAQVREAYQQVAIRQRRDPVLVTTKGPGRVLMQCFPVPVDGEIKVRIGVTAPLLPMGAMTDGRVQLKLPEIIEQNFSVAPEFAHSLWLESVSPLELAAGALRAEKEASGTWAVHGALKTRPGESFPLVKATGSSGAGEAWAVHPQMAGKVFRQSLSEAKHVAGKELVLVVDGSRQIASLVPEIAGQIAALEAGVKITLLLASDVVMTCPVHTPAEVARWLRAQTLQGGQDNLEALSAAWDLASAAGGEVVWIHGPQPHGWQSFEGLLQKETRRPGRVGFRAFPAAQGANVILEKLDGVPRVSAVARMGSLAEDLRAEFARVLTGGGWVFERMCVPAEGVSLDAALQEKAAHIARLWAAEEVQRVMAASPLKRAEAVALAGKFQLVTAVSGAVVLETKAQFDAAGLAAIDPATAPSIPEPATVVLIMGGAAAVFVVWKRRCSRK